MSMPPNLSENDLPGIGVDARGRAIADPTRAVRELNEASVKRLDDLAQERALLVDEKIAGVRRALDATRGDISAMRAEMELRAVHQREMDMQESKRLDAVRQVDQLSVRTEADRSAAAITALAAAAATTAETLRSAVNTSATNLATQLDRTVTAIVERIASLEKSSYTGAGRAGVADPQVERLSQMVESLARVQAQGAGRSAGIQVSTGMLFAAIAAAAAIAGIIARLVH